tara:strand:- start:597 stop:785 length:189 start_codon:yes stop_codon:yes gene_type:complete
MVWCFLWSANLAQTAVAAFYRIDERPKKNAIIYPKLGQRGSLSGATKSTMPHNGNPPANLHS